MLRGLEYFSYAEPGMGLRGVQVLDFKPDSLAELLPMARMAAGGQMPIGSGSFASLERNLIK
jgi:hypothetical protein